MESSTDNAVRLRAEATKADALARRAQRAADEAFRVFLRDDGAASPDQAIDTAKACAQAARAAWHRYVKCIATTGSPAAWRRKTRLKASMPSTGTSWPSADAG